MKKEPPMPNLPPSPDRQSGFVKVGMYLAVCLAFLPTCGGQALKVKPAVSEKQTVMCDQAVTIPIDELNGTVDRDTVLCHDSTVTWTHFKRNTTTSAGEFTVDFAAGESPFGNPAISIPSYNGATTPQTVNTSGTVLSFKYTLSVPPHGILDPHVIVLGTSTLDSNTK